METGAHELSGLQQLSAARPRASRLSTLSAPVAPSPPPAPAGMKDGSWLVGPPAEEVPPELPEPCLGINFARDGMPRKEWLALLAVHSDTWLLSVAFYYAVKLEAQDRMRLFKSINSAPTLFEVVTERRQAPAGGFSGTAASKGNNNHHHSSGGAAGDGPGIKRARVVSALNEAS